MAAVNTESANPGPSPNRLAREKSPYLLQHARNPVDWYPWGDEALARARAEGKPIFLSIGYSTCHWCHVMERETFEDAGIGEYLRRHFISIKVDREERPDVDRIHMAFLQLTTGGGGWPLNVFLTPDLQPFYGGTYFPPEPRHGQPSFRMLLDRIVELWATRRGEIETSAGEITARLREMAAQDPSNAFPTGLRELHGAGQAFLHEYDPVHGGFGSAPKFPRPSQPLYLLRHARRFGDAEARRAVLHTCDRMASGGIHDLLGGGFARYSVDEAWQVPHFDKMLYDNAQLAQLYLDAHLVDGGPRHAEVVRSILRYVARDMTHPEGGFHSAEDADYEGHEGKFYCWTRAEVETVLTPAEAAVVIRHHGITEAGNFVDHSHPRPLAGQNVLRVADPGLAPAERELLASAHRKLLDVRSRRVRPHRDDKILASWNGMMLGAAARAHAVLGDPGFLDMARRNLAFLRARLWDPETRTLHHRWRDGERDAVPLLDDHANLLAGLADLYEATLDAAVVDFAVEVAGSMLRRFHDPEAGGFWQGAADTPHLLVRIKDDYDGAEPSGNSVAALALLRWAAICGRDDWRVTAEKTLRLLAQRLHQFPQAVPHLLMALDFAQQEPKRVVITGDPADQAVRTLLRAAHSVYEPNRVVLGTRGAVEAFARELGGAGDSPRAYCCTGTACQPPTGDPDRVREFLRTVPDAG